MVRKKTRQQDPDSSDSGDGNAGIPGPSSACKHIAKAVQLGTVKKKLKNGIRASCDTCVKKSKIANIVPDASLSNEDEVVDENWTYWLCLTCAHIGCGRGQFKHAMAHYNTPRSDKHDLVVDIESWNVWCYTCEQKMALNSTKKLQECVEYIRRYMQTSKPPSAVLDAVSDASTSVPSPESEQVSTTISGFRKDSSVTDKSLEAKVKNNITTSATKIVSKPSKVRGLMNLGNTCFYNSVLQCLSVTPYLAKTLERLTVSGEEFTLPGDMKAKNFEAPPVHGKLGESGAMSTSLLSLLLDMRRADLHADTLRPQKLLKQVQDTFPQFRGNEQHDAHELLRHLLEGVRSDDLKRFQRVILQQHGLYGQKTDSVAATDKKKIKLYGHQLQEQILGVEGIFKGQLVSIVECQDCRHHSIRFESFLDLSLPVMEDKPLPPMRKKEQTENFASDSGLSKYQAKKQKKAARRNSKSQKAKRSDKMYGCTEETGDGCITIMEEAGEGSEGQESEESDADVEDNVEQDASNPANGKEVGESGYSSEKQNTGESDGTSPSIMAGVEEGERVEPTASSAPASPAVSASHTASASHSPSAPVSASLPESPTAPVSAGASASSGGPSPTSAPQAVMPALPTEDWSTFHTPEHCVDTVCASNCKADGEMRCFTPIDEELRITIPEGGEGSIHISPINPTERPVSRRGYFAGDSNSGGGMTSDFTPELESRLLSLYLSEGKKSPDSNNDENGSYSPLLADVEVGEINDEMQDIKVNDKSNVDQKSLISGNLKSSSREFTLFQNENDHKLLDSNKLSCEEEKVTNGCSAVTAVEDERPSIESFKTGDGDRNDVSGWCKTLAPRHQSEEGDCSVISCLNQFTSLELMTGNNKVGCDACTQRQNKGAEGKTVYTNSTKQLLISSPPPVLILHLKRFMMDNFRFKKLQRFVSFPLDLDIAPFCSTKCKDSPSFEETKTEVKYSLFGIVEHTGSLNTGHYVAYIKIRTELADDDPRWSFLPSTREFVYPKVDASGRKQGGTDEKWYSISDSRVVEIAEAKVLKLQAYLLFYERVS